MPASKTTLVIAAALLVGLGGMIWSQSRGAAMPAIFDQRGYQSALADASQNDRLLVVKFTAHWCGPCRQMDATTLVDPGIEQWFKENAIAAMVDVDSDRDLAAQFKINSIPTLVAIRSGREVSRVSGYLDSEQMIEWLYKANRLR